MKTLKHLYIVLESVSRGLETSSDIARATGIPLKSVSTYLGRLLADGLVRCAGERPQRPSNGGARGGRPSKIYRTP